MRIGILTQPLSRNYGGILQNYALQQVLREMGHEPYTFDLGLYTWKDWLIITIICIIKKVIGMSYHFPETPLQYKNKEKILRGFVDKHITLTSPHCQKPTKKQILKYKFQAIVVGSDQVWRPKYNHSIERMFLDFTHGLDLKRIAYAASFGTSDWEYKERQTKNCRLLAQNFDAISVREDSGVELCEKYLNVSATHVLDPTMLLTKDDYNKLIADIPISTENYLFAYILDKNENKTSFITKIAREKRLTPIIIGADKELNDSDSIEKWLAYFRDAKFIVTDSFHGTVFSIIYNKDFIVIKNEKRGVNRVKSLLSIFDLNFNILDENNLSNIVDSKEFNWANLNFKIDSLKLASSRFLLKNLV
ncbi:MAG: polysaccharide pyruvyl transferase family protein [Paludibacteraceae bacterium]|nr:polysaccharide pyruvyl transferase family protein [Paludibacteraceae bacterium]